LHPYDLPLHPYDLPLHPYSPCIFTAYQCTHTAHESILPTLASLQLIHASIQPRHFYYVSKWTSVNFLFAHVFLSLSFSPFFFLFGEKNSKPNFCVRPKQDLPFMNSEVWDRNFEFVSNLSFPILLYTWQKLYSTILSLYFPNTWQKLSQTWKKLCISLKIILRWDNFMIR
jgi:hypothetical protein